MVINHGLSQCTSTLLVEMDHLFPNQFQSLSEIQQFQRDLPHLISQHTLEVRATLDHQIAELTRHIHELQQEYTAKYNQNMAKITDTIQNMQHSKDDLEIPQESLGKWILAGLKRFLFILQISWLTHNQSRDAKKPLIPLLKEQNMLTKKLQYSKTNYNALIDQQIRPYLLAQQCLNANKEVVIGAVGEESVIQCLQRLPDTFHLLNDITLALSRSVFWKKGKEYVRTAQIDHILIGPTGLFLIETKNWSQNTFINAERSPHFQIDRAAFVFYLMMNSNFKNRIKPRSLVVTLHRMPYTKYPYVDQITVSELYAYIYNRKMILNPEDVRELVEIIINL